MYLFNFFSVTLKPPPRIVESLEEPVASSSIVPMYIISQRARQDVKVVLIGRVPDELFGGYKRHFGVYYGGWWRALSRPLRSSLGAAATRLPRNETLKRGIESLGVNERLRRCENIFSIAPGDNINGLFREGALPEGRPMELVDCWRTLLPQMEHLDELQEVLMDDGSLMFELLKPESVRKLFKAHQSRQQDNHKLLFSLIMLEQWLRRTWSAQKQPLAV